MQQGEKLKHMLFRSPRREKFPRRSLLILGCLALFALSISVTSVAFAKKRAAPPKKILVVTVTKGFRHGDSIPIAEGVLAALGNGSGKFSVDYVRNDADMATKMTPEALKSVDGVVFASTTGDLPLPDRDGFLKWIGEGHAFIGMHAATDTFHGFPAYLDMIGAEFKTHGPQVEVECLNQNKTSPATKHWGSSFFIFDEIYLFQKFERKNVNGLLTMDKHPNEKTPGDYPVAWTKPYGKGRVFYTSLGHRPDVWQNNAYQKHVLGGILWALKLER
jgi:uncharacterized protein